MSNCALPIGRKFRWAKKRCRRHSESIPISERNVYKWYKQFKEGLKRLKSRLVPKTLDVAAHTTLIRDFFAKNETHIVPQPPYSHHATSGYSLNSKDHSGGTVLSRLKRFNVNRHML
ncbi:hypothetical protein CDAR_608781 [Caerostris darwini]|uniref:Mos1 transposase HTH domain-containing protein n=1 Tax=Caerostris darwini TaxID=1538125 RepID=A0AAV4WJ37_9ARAC|nr:hypothetical protein CDAR_608781 [Caerostris darwini]